MIVGDVVSTATESEISVSKLVFEAESDTVQAFNLNVVEPSANAV